jgi:hypothetical protein
LSADITRAETAANHPSLAQANEINRFNICIQAQKAVSREYAESSLAFLTVRFIRIKPFSANFCHQPFRRVLLHACEILFLMLFFSEEHALRSEPCRVCGFSTFPWISGHNKNPPVRV